MTIVDPATGTELKVDCVVDPRSGVVEIEIAEPDPLPQALRVDEKGEAVFVGCPTTLIICGHPRSGTTMLTRVFNSHPDILLTMEFNNFHQLDVPYTTHVRALRMNWIKRSIVRMQGRNGRLIGRFDSAIFVARYLIGLYRYQGELIDASIVTAVLHHIFPRVSIVGDKRPPYVFDLDKLATIEGLARVVIYRDCRDVTSSFMQKARTDWRYRPVVKGLDTAGKVAKRWVSAIELMERHADKVHMIHYEDLVTNPRPVLKALGDWLGVDPEGFRPGIIRAGSVGKYRRGLSEQEVADILAVAGPTMERLGYQV